MCPVLDWDPGTSPESPGTLSFFEQGRAVSTGFRVSSLGQVLAPGNDTLVWPAASFEPPDHLYKGWAYDPALTSGGQIATNGTTYLTKLPVRADGTLTAVSYAVTAAAVTPTAGQNQVAAYRPDGSRIGVVTVDSDITSTGVKDAAISGTLAGSDGFFWALFVFNAATAPTLARASTFASTPNAGLSAATYRFCNNGTGLTAAPASITPGSNNLGNPQTYWAAWK